MNYGNDIGDLVHTDALTYTTAHTTPWHYAPRTQALSYWFTDESPKDCLPLGTEYVLNKYP